MRHVAIHVGILLCTMSALPAQADSVNVISARDNTLYQDANGALSNGAGEFFFAGNNATSQARRGLLYFDVAATLPAGATVNSVMLTLHMSQGGGGAFNVGVHRALANWGEGASNAVGGEGGGAASATGDATWLHTFFNTSFWANQGGDFNAVASAVTSVGAVNFYSWSSAGLVADVQSWLDTPGGNFGWLLRGDETTAASAKRFDTRESLTANFRPVLTIDYTPVPGPASGVVLIASLISMSGRRRRAM